MARFKRATGYDVRFLTGTDEHGQKIQTIANEKGISPQQYVDEVVEGIKKLWETMEISYDDFIRTTEKRHTEKVQKIFMELYEKGDIYKGEYEGWYCTPCESFWTDNQLDEDGHCPDCGRPVSKEKEEAYFFKLSKYQDRLLELLIDYKAYKDYEIILVFDAYRLKNHDTEILNFSGVYVVYTKTAETADQYIEKTTHEMMKKYDVTVATSDGIEQIIIRGKGAILISAREFLCDLEETKENFRKEHIEKQSVSNRLFDSLEGELKQQIEDIRLGNKKEP